MLAHAYAQPNGPDQARDVIVSFLEVPQDSTHSRSVWTVWLGNEQAGEFEDQFDAMRFARSLADERQLPAWMLGPDGQALRRLGN